MKSLAKLMSARGYRTLRAALLPIALLALLPHATRDGAPFDRSPANVVPNEPGHFNAVSPPRSAPRAAPLAAPRAAAQSARLSVAFLPLVAASADLRTDDIVREPAIPTDWTADADFVLGGPAMAIDVVGDIAYVGIGAHLVAMDVSGEGEPVTLGASPPLPGVVADVVVRDGIGYVAVSQVRVLLDDPGGLFMLDVSDPGGIDVLGVTPIVGGATDVAVDGDQALVGSAEPQDQWFEDRWFVGITFFDISDPSKPRTVRRWPAELERRSHAHPLSRRMDVALIGDVGYVCDDKLFVLDVGAMDKPREVEPEVPCVAIELLDGGARLIASSDESHSYDPKLRMLTLSDPIAPTVLWEIPILGEDDSTDYPFVVADMSIGVEDDVIHIARWSDEGRSFVGRIDLRGYPEVERQWTELDGIIALGIDANEERAIFAAAANAMDSYKAAEALSLGAGHVLGSAVGSTSLSYEGSRSPVVRLTGPSTLVTALTTYENRAYVFDQHFSTDVAVLWAFDMSSRYPTILGVSNPEPGMDPFSGYKGSLATATASGVFILGEGRIIHTFDVRGDDPIPGDGIPIFGAMVAEGDTLFVAVDEGSLEVYDVSDPNAPTLFSMLRLPAHEWYTAALEEGRLWLIDERNIMYFHESGADLGRNSTDRASSICCDQDNRLIDVSNPARPTEAGPFPRLEDEGDVMWSAVWRVETDGLVTKMMVANLGRGVNELATFRSPSSGSAPILVSRESIPEPFGDFDFTYTYSSARWRDHLWLVTQSGEVSANELDLLALSTLSAGDDEVLDTAIYRLASGARARHTQTFDELVNSNVGAGMAIAAERLIVTRIEGGVMGYSSMPGSYVDRARARSAP